MSAWCLADPRRNYRKRYSERSTIAVQGHHLPAGRSGPWHRSATGGRRGYASDSATRDAGRGLVNHSQMIHQIGTSFSPAIGIGSSPMKIRIKKSDERSRCGHGIVTDLRGQDQPLDRSRAQQVSTARESVEPRRQRNVDFTMPKPHRNAQSTR
jgi:hypothetical protein